MPGFVIFVWQQRRFLDGDGLYCSGLARGSNGMIQEDGTEECGNWKLEPGVMLPDINLGRVAISAMERHVCCSIFSKC